ncbi:class I SAM-dependent methyltransferase [Flavobacterium sp. RNTU_13]|uniref:class I SAM-dependent methyltransferase n=1 Tax=Flavobacterium sp. RNTU_13 TaxID=3375145 RepID=UPI0039858D3F
MKDNFSAQANDYARFRPHYPAEMIQYIMSNVSQHQNALDVATGNGQVAAALSPYFKEVYAVDISEQQLANATQLYNVHYKMASAEDLGFKDNTFDLITVAQAIHWFDFNAFYKEVNRLLNSNGVFAVLGYGLFSAGFKADKVLYHLYREILGTYWDEERRYLDENYSTIPFPFAEIVSQKFENRFSWNVEQLLGYLNTWSAVQHYINKNGINPVDLVKTELQTIWGRGEKEVVFPLLLRVGRKV